MSKKILAIEQADFAYPARYKRSCLMIDLVDLLFAEIAHAKRGEPTVHDGVYVGYN